MAIEVKHEDVIVGDKGKVPESADLAVQYVIWLLEKVGLKFKQGKTALYWNIIHTIMSHIE